MSGILKKMTPAIALGKQDKILHTNAIVLMGVFTFLFLGAEYLYDNMIALAVSEDQTVFAQNYALGASAVGFLLYAVFHRFFNRLSQRVCSVLFAPVSVLCLFVIALHLSYGATLLSGLILFLLFGLLGGGVFYTSVCILKTGRYLARTVGISYMLGILLQFANHYFVSLDTAEAVVLSVFALILWWLFLKTEGVRESGCHLKDERSEEKKKPEDGKPSGKGASAGILLILLVALMACIFSTLDNTVTLAHAAGSMDIGQWPRILLACSGVLAGFLFDLKDRKFMMLIMYCVMMLSTACIAVLTFAGPFLVGLMIFYFSAGFFAVFFTTAFMELSCYMEIPELWSGMGRTVNNLVAVVLTNGFFQLLSAGNMMTVIILILILFTAVSVVSVACTSQMNALKAAFAGKESEDLRPEDKLKVFSEAHSFTPRETEVFCRLVRTEDSIQEIAESLYISKRTLERYISAIYEKTGAKSRIGLIHMYHDL